MPVQHTIDDDRKLIITTWTGVATDGDFITALSNYQSLLKSRPEYIDYDELLDLSGTSSFNLTAGGLRRISELGAKLDTRGVRTRLAIVVTQTVAYGLARMYQTYRSLIPSASKEVQIFRNSLDALRWLEGSQEGATGEI